MVPFAGEIDFRDAGRASDSLARLTAGLSEELQSRVCSMLAASPDPDQALLFLDRFRQERPAELDRILAVPQGLPLLMAIFSNSRFLSEAVLSHPEWAGQLLQSGGLQREMHGDDYRERLESELASEGSGSPSPLVLALFRRRQLLRIAARDAMGLCSLAEVTEDLSNLADAIVEVTCRRIHHELSQRHGAPEECDFTIISLGKLGGKELNYSSDIDLMFLYARNGETAGPSRLSYKEFYKKLANRVTQLLSTYTSAGTAYRVDLRLRPDGRLGEVVISLDGAKTYYRERARDWELQMLIKARVSAGNRELGSALLDFVEPLTYSSTLDFSVVEAASETRQRISEKMAARKPSQGFNIKLARGGIRDIEFLVQCLQRLHGGREPWVRHGGTLLALSRLHDKDFLSPHEYSTLAGAYQFLRHIEHRLQLEDDLQTHSLPRDPVELGVLARKLPGAHFGESITAEQLMEELHRNLADVQEVYERVIHAQRPIYYTLVAPPAEGQGSVVVEDSQQEPASNMVRFLDQRAPQLAKALSRATLRRGRVHFEHFLERVLQQGPYLDLLDREPKIAGYVFDMFEHSSYFAEQLIRVPELLHEFERVRRREPLDLSGMEAIDDATDLRREFRRVMFRIQAESVCLQAPIFSTLEQTSDLADAVIGAAYRTAVDQVLASKGPSNAGYKPLQQMMAVTMGRLGMREFDLGSDADLIFVLPDSDASELPFWTRVAEKIISILTSYTGEGTVFSVDTRLRPNGRSGPLVQTECGYQSYFTNQAEAWEGISYMKCRAVAGDMEAGTRFLNTLQELDWRRYGQSGRSRKQLAQMRARLEKEQGGDNPLKAGRGGYYDIDFALMYLRLKGAGIFYKVLNTPARIDVIEKMGHLERPDADFLRDAATFYRAVDHGLRITTGHAEGRLPAGGSQLEVLDSLVRRWTPEYLHDQPLDVELAQVQDRTREFFDRLFKA